MEDFKANEFLEIKIKIQRKRDSEETESTFQKIILTETPFLYVGCVKWTLLLRDPPIRMRAAILYREPPIPMRIAINLKKRKLEKIKKIKKKNILETKKILSWLKLNGKF